MIQLRDVTKQFSGPRRDITALDRVSLDIGRGEMVSIVGPSGSGKSTLLNLIGGLDGATGGQILIDRQDLAHLSDDDLTRVRRDSSLRMVRLFRLRSNHLKLRRTRDPVPGRRFSWCHRCASLAGIFANF